MHSKCYLHRDIKPENFMIGINQNRNHVYMIDFGLAKRFKNNNNIHMCVKTGKKLVGTARYASINCHKGIEMARRDDLESFIYLLIYMLKGKLPWQGLPGRNREEKYEHIKQSKIATTTKALCSGCPIEFFYFLDHVKSLKFKEKPNYRYLRYLLLNIMKNNGI